MEPIEEKLFARGPGPPIPVMPLGSRSVEEHLAPTLAPIPTAARTGSSGAAATARNAPDLSKRRRGPGFVTTNACTECRTKRAKCDGQMPCTRCKTGKKDAKCVYETPIRQSKETLRHEIEQLKRQEGNSDSVFAALAQPELKEEVLTRLRHGQSIESISGWLARTLPSEGNAFPTPSSIVDQPRGPSGAAILLNPSATSHEPTGPELGTLNPMSSHSQSTSQDISQNSPCGRGSLSSPSNCNPDTRNWSPDTVQGGCQCNDGSRLESYSLSDDQHRRAKQDELPTPNMLGMKLSPRVWTNITPDSNLIQHLLSLYFCWEYPIFASLSKEHFLMDFRDGHDRFCSEILINALLALGCRFSNRLDAYENPNDPCSAGDHFFRESKRLLLQESNSHKLTTIQALGIMSIREASCGRGSGSWYYAGQSIHLAIEMGLHQDNDDTGDEEEIAVRVATFWGCFALDQVWSLAIGSLPQGSYFPNLPPKPVIISDKEATLWVPYTDDGHLLQSSGKQLSNVQSVFQCSCELSKIIHQSLYIFHSPGQSLTSQSLLEIYTLYLNWYDKVPEALRLGNNYTPAVLFTHMYYHFAILLLFQPLIKLRIVGSSVSPRNMCLQAANTIQGLLRSYSQLYTLRRTPSFIPYFALMSTTTHLAIGALYLVTPQASVPNEPSQGGQQELQQVPASGKIDLHVTQAIRQGIADLTEMAPCHQFAEQALNILLHLSKQWNVDLEVEGAGDDSRTVSGTQTVDPSFFSPNVNEQVGSWCTAVGAGPQPEVRAKATVPTLQMMDALENPLFWPFLRHGGPSAPSGPLPADSGFELL